MNDIEKQHLLAVQRFAQTVIDSRSEVGGISQKELDLLLEWYKNILDGALCVTAVQSGQATIYWDDEHDTPTLAMKEDVVSTEDRKEDGDKLLN